ncbi:MAG TPA: hypothetical protein VGF76_02855 [Polyangiaceae bacterium]|jgi:hypothetical protein
MRHVLYFLGLSLGAAALGCSSSTTATTTIARPELVAVTPDDFVNELSAADAKRVQSYVATLFDVTPAADGGVPSLGFQLASSPPTSPSLPVTFSFVITNHAYLAQVDAYEEAPAGGPDAGAATHIAPASSGGRLQFDEKNGARVTPRWVFTCGGYPPTPDAGSFGGAAAMGEDFPAGAAGDDGAFPPGIVAYDGFTQTLHDCRPGLPPVTN